MKSGVTVKRESGDNNTMTFIVDIFTWRKIEKMASAQNMKPEDLASSLLQKVKPTHYKKISSKGSTNLKESVA